MGNINLKSQEINQEENKTVATKLEEAQFKEILFKASRKQRYIFISSIITGLALIFILAFLPQNTGIPPYEFNNLQKELKSLEKENATLKSSIAKIEGISVEENLKQKLEYVTPEQIQIKNALCIANLLVLGLFIILLSKKQKLEFKEKLENDGNVSGQIHYSSLLEVMKDKSFGSEDAIKFNNKVNRLAKQFSTFIILYAVLLMIVYSLFMLDSGNNPLHKYYKMGQDIFNYLSAVFVYLSFKVLFNKTFIRGERKPYFWGTIILTVCYIGTYIALFDATDSNKIISTLLSLIAGMGNGLAMILLFSRYISMSFMVKKMKEMSYSGLFSIGLVYILPIYAIFQPLFGNFHVKEFGSVDFANFVFFVCFIGKLFFLYATYLLISKKILHIFLHLVINEHYTSNWFEDCFNLSRK